MRKAMLFMVAGMLAASLTEAGAAEVAACQGMTSLTGVPGNMTFAGSCAQEFSLASETTVTLTLAAGPGFTGTLKGYLTSVESPRSITAEGVYIAGELVQGTGVKANDLTAGTWKMRVETKTVLCESFEIPSVTPGCVNGPSVAVGSFGAAATLEAIAPPA